MSTGTSTSGRAAATAPYDLVVVGAAVALSAVGTLLWGFGREALATGLGASLAVANWLALRWLGVRLLGLKPAGSWRRRVVLAIVFALKLVVLIAAIWVLIRWAGLEPFALALGYSALVVGLFGASLLWSRERTEGGADA